MDATELISLGLFDKKDNSEDGIEVVSCTLMELFNSHKKAISTSKIAGFLMIPEYQRPYVWKAKELKKLVKDVSAHNNNTDANKPLYYLGSIILHIDKSSNKLNIIDGQQRITTLLLWYSLQNKAFKFPLVYTSPSSIAQIQKNAFYFKRENELPSIRLEEFNVTIIATHHEDDAYTFFETQNTGGVRLSGADIIKSHHLRAIENTTVLNTSAKEWEQLNHLSYVIDLATKARYWDYLQWREYPSFRKEKQLKEAIVEEFTERTKKGKKNISFRQVQLIEDNAQKQIRFDQKGKTVRQPLHDGTNTVQYFKDIVACYESLFVAREHPNMNAEFYKFRDELLTGKNGTVFLKELFELSAILYVNRFGYHSFYEFALWLFRYIYSKRVTSRKTVRENSIFKFVRENRVLDVIANAYTHEEIIDYLKFFHYDFNGENTTSKNVKGRYISGLSEYFSKDFKKSEQSQKEFDQLLKRDIYAKLKEI